MAPVMRHRLIPLLGLLLLVFAGPAPAAAPQEWQSHDYKVVRVVDGDTFVASDGNIQFWVRIAGMDAPEKGQPYSKLATTRLKKRINGKYVKLKPLKRGTDRYKRVLAHVYWDGGDVALLMIQEGLATYYRPKCRDYPADKNSYSFDPQIYLDAEAQAKAAKKHLWSEQLELPCHYRQRMRKK